VAASGHRGTPLVASEGIAARQVAGVVDPHAWHDLGHARHYAARIAAALQRLRPGAAAVIGARAAAYDRRLQALDGERRRRLADLPAEARRVITAHGGWGYLGQATGLEFIAPLGWRTDAEPSAAAVARLIALIRQRQVRAVFIDSLRDDRLMRQIATESGAVVGGRLYGDALSRPGGEADSFVRLCEHNLDTLARALTVRS
jgi:zinc/manganese transport system substrate-binding protein